VSASPRILLIGFGNMGQALVRGWLARGYDATAVTVVDPQATARAVAVSLGCAAVDTATGADLEAFDVVVVAVKPQQLGASLGALASAPAVGRIVFLSIVAGATTAQLGTLLGVGARIVRAMPNTPAAIGQGVTGLFAVPAVSAAERALCADLMGAVGIVEWLAQEQLMDAVTALSGSGPAYVFLLIECLAQAGAHLGLDAAVAARLAAATVAGAGRYALESGDTAAELRRRVTSPQGTTEAALAVLQTDGEFANLIERALAAAARRSRELSQAG
jgi:pyrroline-5-carboxylate reductase